MLCTTITSGSSRLWRLHSDACLQQPPPHPPAAASGTCRGLRGPEQSLPRVQHDALWLDKTAAAARPQNCPALPLEVLEDIPLHKDKPTTEVEAGQCTQALSKQASGIAGLPCNDLLCLPMPPCCRAEPWELLAGCSGLKLQGLPCCTLPCCRRRPLCHGQ